MDLDDLAAAEAAPHVLTVLREGANDGYALLQRVRARGGRGLDWPDGMLYPLLHRLRRAGYVTVEWRTLSDGRHRRFYGLPGDDRATTGARRRRSAGGGRGWSAGDRLLALATAPATSSRLPASA